MQDFACTADIRRAVLIGLRPDDQREHADPFALLRAITVHKLYRHSTRLRRRSHAMGLDPRGGDLPAGPEAAPDDGPGVDTRFRRGLRASPRSS